MSTELEHREETEGGELEDRQSGYYYSPEFKARALVLLEENNFHYAQTARELGIDRALLWRWHNKREGITPAVLQRTTQIKEQLIARWNESINQGFDLMPEKMEKMSGQALSLHIGLGTDKVLRLLGEPTQVVEHRLVLIRQVYEEIKGLVPDDEARQLITQEFELKPEDWKVIENSTPPASDTGD